MDSDFMYEIDINREERYIHVIAKGNINLESLKLMYASVVRYPQYESGMSRLWNFSHLNVSLLSSDHLRSFAQFMKNEDLGTDTAYSAVLVSRDFEYGMIRMLQALGDGVLSPNVLVTRSKDEALAWIVKHNKGDVRK